MQAWSTNPRLDIPGMIGRAAETLPSLDDRAFAGFLDRFASARLVLSAMRAAPTWIKCEELTIGQLCRERFAAEAALIGCGTHTGTVAAADDCDEPMQIKWVKEGGAPGASALQKRTSPCAGGRFLLRGRVG